jgi:hypothetical protein
VTKTQPLAFEANAFFILTALDYKKNMKITKVKSAAIAYII